MIYIYIIYLHLPEAHSNNDAADASSLYDDAASRLDDVQPHMT